MDYRNQNLNNITKAWINSFLVLLIKNGKKLLSNRIVYFVLKNVLKKYKNLNKFFWKISKLMYLPVLLRNRVVAGRKVYIPYRVTKFTEIKYIARLILKIIKNRPENNLITKITNELFDIFNNKGLSIKRRNQLCKEIKDNVPNLRFLKYN